MARLRVESVIAPVRFAREPQSRARSTRDIRAIAARLCDDGRTAPGEHDVPAVGLHRNDTAGR